MKFLYTGLDVKRSDGSVNRLEGFELKAGAWFWPPSIVELGGDALRSGFQADQEFRPVML